MKRIIEKKGSGFFRNFLHAVSVPSGLQRHCTRWKLVAALAIAAFARPGYSSEVLFRQVSGGDERARTALAELNAYYAESPGFKHAKVIVIDTITLKENARRMEVRERAAALPAVRGARGLQDERVLEWEGDLPGSSGRFDLKKIDGKFYGSYHENGEYHIITPYRSQSSEGEWMVVALVYQNRLTQCGTGMHTGKTGEEVER